MLASLRAAAELQVGQEVAGRYRLEAVLGVGGMGAVFSARHLVTGRLAALKRIHPHLAQHPSQQERFVREARAVGSLGHPGIVEVLDAGMDGQGASFLVFELLEGEDLAQAIQRRAVPPRRLVAVLLELVDALAAAHAAGFVHRDVKPANIFLARGVGGQVRTKLLDFGVVRATEGGGSGLTRVGAIIGTPWYMSPEQLVGDVVDGRADLWATCVVLHYGLVGRLPFGAEQPAALLAEIATGPPSVRALRPELPGEADELFTRGFQLSLDRRFASAERLRDALKGLAAALDRIHDGPPTWKTELEEVEAETRRLKARK